MKSGVTAPKLVRFGLFEVDLATSELRKDGRKVKLQDQPCRILAILLDDIGKVVTREELSKRLWPDGTFVDFDHSLNTAVMRLREALGDSSDSPRFIETLPRHGYRFIAPVEEILIPEPVKPRPSGEGVEQPASVPATAPDNSLMTNPASPMDERRRHFRVARSSFFLGAAVTALLLLAVGFALRRPFNRSASASAVKQINSVVVLPFENLSGDNDQQYFTDGMTDALIAHLAKIRSLRVISRTSAMGYKGTHKTLSEIARDLDVDAAVEGTVLRSGNRVRITAELVQVSTDRHLWAETYESALGDVLGLQSQVASAIVNEIRINLSPEDQQRLSTTHNVSTEGYEDYLKGRYYWNKRSEEGLKKAITYFQLATKKDPDYALAYAGLADCYSIIGSAIVGSVPSKDVAPSAEAAARKALELDPALAEAHTSLATVRFNYDWDWPGAASEFQRSIELNPSYATAYQRYSLYLMAMGRTNDSLTQMNHARDLDPLSISMNFSLGWRQYMARHYDQAIEQLHNTLDLDPNFALPHLVLGQTYEQKGAYPQAIAEMKKAATISNASPMVSGSLGHLYGISRDRADAESILQQLLQQSKTQYVSPFYVALVYVGLRENDRAIDWLEAGFKDRSNAIIFLKVDPELDALRPLPRFQSLLHRMKFPQ